MYSPSSTIQWKQIGLLLILLTIPFVAITQMTTTDLLSNSQLYPVLPKLHNFSFPSFLKHKIYSRQNIKWKIPSIDQQLLVYNRQNTFTKRMHEYPWYRPLIYLTAARTSDLNSSEIELFLYGQGLTMGKFERNFTSVGCLVGSTIYPISIVGDSDVFICRISRKIQANEFLSIVIVKDKYLEQALTKKSIQLKMGLNVSLGNNDLSAVPRNYEVHPDILKKTKGKELYYARSIVRFPSNYQWLNEQQRKEKVRYEICGCTQMKLYPHLTVPWVDYHRRIGMDFMFVIDNNASQDLSKMFPERSDVKVQYWPYAKSQAQIWSYMIPIAQKKCEWLFLFDADEFVMFGLGKNMEYANKKPIKLFTDRLRKSDKIAAEIHYTEIVNNEYVKIPNKPVPEIYIYGRENQNPHCKTMLYMDFPWAYSTIHYGKGWRGHSINEGIHYSEGGLDKKPVNVTENPVLVHYQLRSWEETVLKKQSLTAAVGDTIGLGYPNYKPDLDHAPSWFTKKNESLKYTHFRTLWREVTKKANMNEQTLVTTRNGQRCKAVINVRSKKVKRSVCEKIVVDDETKDPANGADQL